MATTVTWDGPATLSLTHDGNGVVTFRVIGRATEHIDTGSTIIDLEAQYEVLCNNVRICYISQDTKYNVATTVPNDPRTYVCRAFALIDGVYYYATSGNPTCTFTTPGPDFIWSDGANVTAEQSGQNYIFTLHGDVTKQNGYEPRQHYFMWVKDSTIISDWYLTDKTYTLTPQYYSEDSIYYVYPYIITGDVVTQRYVGTFGSGKGYTFKGNGYVVYYDGSQWVKCSMKYYDGTDWVACKPHYYNGSEWIDISSSV